MTCAFRERREGGFSLVEVLVVLTVTTIIGAIGVPALNRQIQRSKLVGASAEFSVHLLRARMEAVKLGFPVVVMPDYARRGFTAFRDEDGDLTLDAGEKRIFDLAVPGTGSYIYLMGPDGQEGSEANPAQSADGLTAAGSLRVAVFEPDGSIRDPGAFRIADGKQPRGNTLEVRVGPRATARIETGKYVYDGPDGTGFYPSGEGVWKWY